MFKATENSARVVELRDEIKRIIEVIEIQKIDGRPRSPTFQRQQENQRLRLEEIKLELLQLMPRTFRSPIMSPESELA